MQGAVLMRDIFNILDKKGVVVRAGQHCVGLLMTHARKYHLMRLIPCEQHKYRGSRIAKPAEAGA